MQNTIEKGMKVHPVGTLIAVLACMLIFYVCNFIVMKFSRNENEEDMLKEVKERVEEVKLSGQTVPENETMEQEKVEDIVTTEKDIDKRKVDRKAAKISVETKQLPTLVKS